MDNEETDVTDSSTEQDTSVSTDQKTDRTSETDSTGSEVDTNADEGKDKSVPYDRFHEVNEAKKQAELRAQEAEQELERLKNTSSESEEELDPDVEKMLERFAVKKGFVSKAEVQLQNDVQELKSEYAKSGVPFDDKKVYDYAKANGLPLNSKSSWRAAYRDMNHDAILESERKRAVAEYREGAKSTGEKPGPGGAKKPTEPKLLTRKERIHAAANKIYGGNG